MEYRWKGACPVFTLSLTNSSPVTFFSRINYVLDLISQQQLFFLLVNCIMDMAQAQQEIRIAIRFITSNVPGQPRDRPRRVADDFASSKLSRSFSYDHDFVHLHPDIYLDTTQSVWLLCDFNVYAKVPRVEAVPIQWWVVSYDQQQSPRFTQRQMNGKFFTNRLPWGGRDNEWEYRLQQRNTMEKSREELITGK